MAGLRVYRSNRTEVLVDALAEVVREPLGSPLDREWIVVQGRGMAVWLARQLSQRLSVWATLDDFLYPKSLVQKVLEVVLGDRGVAAAGYGRDRLVWAVLGALERELDHPSMQRLASYLEGDTGGLERYELASRLADVFDQYVTYRPEMVRGWREGRDELAVEHGEAWQPILWRAVTDLVGGPHLADLEHELLGRLSQAERPEGLPRRVSVFGLSSLPPLYARVVVALARHVEVHLMILSPSREHWSELASRRERRRAVQKGQPLAGLHLDGGHLLLDGLGELGADFAAVLDDALERLEVAAVEVPGLYREPPPSLLGRLQADVLDLTVSDCPADDSIQLHCCHGRMREVEVLRDRLLDMLTGDTDLRPHEVVVMLPDVEGYAPLIEAVFERDRGDKTYLPYRIADRPLRSQSPVLEALFRVLSLVGSRMAASQVLDLLALEPFARRFDIAAAEVGTIAEWIAESGARWGIDALHRQEHGQPPIEQNTWRFGLDRLLVGYALPLGGRTTYQGVLPYDELEGQSAELAGRLAALCEALFSTVRELSRPRAMAGWRDAISALLDRLLYRDAQSGWQHDRVRAALARLCEAAGAAGFSGEVGVDVVVRLLDGELEAAYPARGFGGAGVTFCAMVPMRTIPFEVVCLLGMDDGVFPRSTRAADFDLIARAGRRPGDRSRRQDDRYLFLEAILSARRRLYIGYRGLSVRDNSPTPPSVVVSELREVLARMTGDVASLTTSHRLQPFSRAYFDGRDRALYSYERAYLEGAAASGGKVAERPLFQQRLPPSGDGEPAMLSLSELASFVRRPVRYLLERRLGISMALGDGDIGDREPLQLGPLERHKIREQILELRVAAIDDTSTLVRASGALPLGTPGDLVERVEAERAEPIAVATRRLRLGGRTDPLWVERRLPCGTVLVGEVGHRWHRGIVRHQPGRIRGRQLLSFWIDHLAASWLGTGEATYVIGLGDDAAEVLRLRPVGDAEAKLDRLVQLYHVGQREPLLLFPEAGLVYVQKLREKGDERAALHSARNTYEGEIGTDPHLQRMFGAAEVIDPDAPPLCPDFVGPRFIDVALEVFGPLCDALEEDP